MWNLGRNGRTLAAFAAGAAVAFFLSPPGGPRRRAVLRDALRSRRRRLGRFAAKAAVDLKNRASGAGARARRRFEDDAASDDVLAERVRARLGREVSHPRALEVEAREGRVTLRGPILAHEVDRVLRAAASVRGVRGVEDRFEPHDTRAGVPALQGGTERRARPELLQENWAPATRLGAAALGGGLALLGARALAGGTRAGAAGLGLGGALLLRAVVNQPLRRTLALRGGRGAVELQKTLEIDAPRDEVFGLWSAFENLPRFMDHVLEVRTAEGGRSHWKVRSAAGTEVEWDAEITQLEPGRSIAWRSLPGSRIQNAGSVRFEPVGPARTRLDVRLSYAPPGGVLGHGAATLLGADPKRALDEDLVRLKSLLEQGKTTAHGETVTRESVQETPSAPR